MGHEGTCPPGFSCSGRIASIKGLSVSVLRRSHHPRCFAPMIAFSWVVSLSLLRGVTAALAVDERTVQP